jgi:hypothetical protein
MGANAQTTVPSFTSGQVLTADQQNQSARTGVPVFATTVERDAAFGGSGEKTLAEGQLAYLEDSDIVQYYDGSGWATVGPTEGGLALITTGTMTAAATVTVDGCFTSTYDEYLLVFDVVGTTASILTLGMRSAGSTITAANYQRFRMGFNNAGATDNAAAGGETSWLFGFATSTVPSVFTFNIYDPVASRVINHHVTGVSVNQADTAAAVYTSGLRYSTAQAMDGFIITVSAGTMTGTVRVYGLAK